MLLISVFLIIFIFVVVLFNTGQPLVQLLELARQRYHQVGCHLARVGLAEVDRVHLRLVLVPKVSLRHELLVAILVCVSSPYGAVVPDGSDEVHGREPPLLQVAVEVPLFAQVQIVDGNLVGSTRHTILLVHLRLASEQGSQQRILQKVKALLSQVQFLEAHLALHVNMIHHVCLRVPRRVGERLGQPSSQPRYLPVDVVLAAHFVDEAWHERVGPLALVILRLEHVVVQQLDSDVGQRNHEQPVVVIVGPLNSKQQ